MIIEYSRDLIPPCGWLPGQAISFMEASFIVLDGLRTTNPNALLENAQTALEHHTIIRLSKGGPGWKPSKDVMKRAERILARK